MILLSGSTKKEEILKVKVFVENILANLEPPKTEWEKKIRVLMKMEMMLQNLRARKIMTAKEEREIRIALAPLSYKAILDSPYIKEDNEKKERIRISLLEDWLHLSGLCKAQ